MVERLDLQSRHYQLTVEQVFANPATLASVQLIKRDELQLPDHLNALLAEGQTIALKNKLNQLYYYHNSPNYVDLYRFGPVTAEEDNEDVRLTIFILFYSCLVLVALAWIWPVFRDLNLLQQAAVSYGKDHQKVDFSLKKSSAIYPLAHEFRTVANQMVHLVEMHKSLSQTISHEVRTPLARMRFALELIKPQIATSFSEQMESDLKDIEQVATNYLSFARLEHQQDQLTVQVDLAQFVDDLQKKFNHETKLSILFSHQGQFAMIEPVAMRIACQNLLINAQRYAKSTISFHFHSDQHNWQVRVEDDGPGFSEQGHSMLQAFKRQSNDSSGYGLGLFIVQQIARWHQAEVQVQQSELLGGASVSLCYKPPQL